jgi:hypothetical protein
MRFHFYSADYDGWRVLVTPWPMVQNAEGLVELTDEELKNGEYSALVRDADSFYQAAGVGSAVLLYDLRDSVSGNGPNMVASFWLQGPLAGKQQPRN